MSFDRDKFELHLKIERHKRGVPVDLELAIIKFDPKKHPRDLTGKFREILGGLQIGDEVDVPGGSKVTRTKDGFAVSGGKAHPYGKDYPGGPFEGKDAPEFSTDRPDDAAKEALLRSAASEDPGSVGGERPTLGPAALRSDDELRDAAQKGAIGVNDKGEDVKSPGSAKTSKEDVPSDASTKPTRAEALYTYPTGDLSKEDVSKAWNVASGSGWDPMDAWDDPNDNPDTNPEWWTGSTGGMVDDNVVEAVNEARQSVVRTDANGHTYIADSKGADQLDPETRYSKDSVEKVAKALADADPYYGDWEEGAQGYRDTATALLLVADGFDAIAERSGVTIDKRMVEDAHRVEAKDKRKTAQTDFHDKLASALGTDRIQVESAWSDGSGFFNLPGGDDEVHEYGIEEEGGKWKLNEYRLDDEDSQGDAPANTLAEADSVEELLPKAKEAIGDRTGYGMDRGGEGDIPPPPMDVPIAADENGPARTLNPKELNENDRIRYIDENGKEWMGVVNYDPKEATHVVDMSTKDGESKSDLPTEDLNWEQVERFDEPDSGSGAPPEYESAAATLSELGPEVSVDAVDSQGVTFTVGGRYEYTLATGDNTESGDWELLRYEADPEFDLEGGGELVASGKSLEDVLPKVEEMVAQKRGDSRIDPVKGPMPGQEIVEEAPALIEKADTDSAMKIVEQMRKFYDDQPEDNKNAKKWVQFLDEAKGQLESFEGGKVIDETEADEMRDALFTIYSAANSMVQADSKAGPELLKKLRKEYADADGRMRAALDLDKSLVWHPELIDPKTNGRRDRP